LTTPGGRSILDSGMVSLSAVVVNWNGGGVLLECLGSLFASDPGGGELEVILVDNASTDGSQREALAAFPQARLLQNDANEGFARAGNRALRMARGRFALLLNPDVVLEEPAVGTLLAFLTAHPDAAIAGPLLLDPDGSRQGSARRDPSPWTGLFGRSAVLTRIFPGNPLSRRELPGIAHAGDAPMPVDWLAGACLMVRRAAYEAVGLLDERFFLYWEDADWCLRFRKAGWQIYYVPAARAVHRVGVSRARRPVRSALDFHWSAYYYYRKHFLPSALHPMIVPLVGGLALHAVLRVGRALAGRR
jgi:GT2 family glycosyltransferase